MKALLTTITTMFSVAAMACPNGTESKMVNGNQLCSLKGNYVATDLRLTSQFEYLIEDGVFIGGDNEQKSTLRIEPGTVIRGNPASFIAIMRGSQIYAEGTKQKPITFTSLKKEGRKRGEWGGIVLNGNAPINACRSGVAVCEAISEGIKVREVKFGGNQSEDSSGVLKFVRVEFAGYPIAPDNELNGITFNGVGSGTVVENIQVHMNADDGIEFFGGTVNAKYVVLTENEDDSLDWDMGWTGKVQFVLVDQGVDVVDGGIEADNLKSPMNASPRSNPTLSNVTLIGSEQSGLGILLRRGTGAQIYNTIVTGFKKACFDIDDNETFVNASSPEGIVISHTILNCAKAFNTKEDDLFSLENWFVAQPQNRLENPKLKGWMPLVGSPALGGGMTPDDFFFEPVDFIGAFGTENWAQDWTVNARQ